MLTYPYVKGITPMSGSIVSRLVYVVAFVGISPLAYAAPTSAAPAPLLAAGIPAFMAIGGGALIARLRGRKK